MIADIAKRIDHVAVLIFLVSLAARFYFLGMVKNDPVFLMPVVDSLEFDVWAWNIASGQLLWPALSNHPPLYAYFVAAIYKIFGYSPQIVVIIQYLIASLANVLMYLIVRRLLNKATAIVCALFMATYWFFIYVQSFLFSENLVLFLDIMLVYVLLFFNNCLRKYFLAGLLLGLSVICRTQLLLFPVLLPVWFFIQKIPLKTWIRFYALFLAGFLLMVAPVLWQNYRISGELLLRTQTGANFYMGNHPDFKGTNLNVQIGKEWQDFISRPHQALKKNVSEAESDRYFFHETFKVIRERPWDWAGTILSKIFYLLTGRDFLRTEDMYVFGNYVLQTPYSTVSTRLIFLPAIIGFFLLWPQAKNLSLIFLLLLSHAAIILFPIKTRYLVALMPFVMIFAAYALVYFYNCLKTKQTATALKIAGLLVLLNLFSFYNPLRLKDPDVSETYYAIAKNYTARSRDDKAAVYFEETLRINPHNISAYNDLGVILMNSGDFNRALEYFQKAISLDPTALNPRLNYELCVEKMKIR